jgi:predicted XRE-type DNA-binding protein
MNLILFDNPTIRQNLLPFTFTRPVASIRVGILTIAEKWEKYLGVKASYATEAYLSKKFPLHHQADNLWINGAVCPNTSFVKAIKELKLGDALSQDEVVLAVRTQDSEVPEVITGAIHAFTQPVTVIDQVWKIYQKNGAEIREDFALLTQGRKSATIQDSFHPDL